jgi:signal transduction histidine kinase/CheY-like chemotaxis protein
MQAVDLTNRRILSWWQIGLLGTVVLLAVSVEVLIVRTYSNSTRTADYFNSANFITTDLADLNREALLLQLETNRYFQHPDSGTQQLFLRRSLLSNQITMQTGQARGNAGVVADLTEVRDTLNEHDALWTRFADASPQAQIDLESEINIVLIRLERQIKTVYDREEFNLAQATGTALDGQRTASLMLLALAGLVLVLGVLLVVSMSRTVRALRRQTIERARAEEANRQLAESLELRVIERTAELSDTLKQLEDVSRHKSEFLANMSHELRTPLNAIIGYSEMLQEEAEAAQQAGLASDLQKIGASGMHLLELVNEVLDFAKIESGKMELHLETFNVPQMLIDVAAVLQPLAERNESSLAVHCDDNVVLIHADLTKVRQTLINLLGNACKFTRRGSITLSAARSDQDGGDWISFSVADTGIGINSQQMSRLFQPFTQADSSTTRKYGGTGLGLVLSRQMCRMMGGDIAVESEEGKGSTFICTLPAEVRPDRSESGRSGPARVVLDIEGGSGLALAIGGDEAAQVVTRRLLADAGFQVAGAASGEEGLRLARELRPEVITLDVFVPGLNAWEVLVRLKSAPDLAGIRVIMLAGANHLPLGLARGATEFLVDPVDRRHIAGILDRYRPRQAPYTALVVEDDTARRESIVQMLEQEGWAVLQAEDGALGLKRLAEVRPDLILMHLFMPTMDGFEFLEELGGREEWSGLPVIAIIGREMDANAGGLLNERIKKIMDQRANGTPQDIFGSVVPFVPGAVNL